MAKAKKTLGKSIKQSGVSILKKTVDTSAKAIVEVSPARGNADKSKITDTGTESVKSAKSGIKTAKKTVKTTKNTVKTVKNTPKNVKRTVKTTYRVTKAVVKTAIKAGKAAVKVISKIIAVLIENPVILLIILIVFIVMYIIYACVTVLGGGAAGSAVTRQEFQEAGGLENVPENLKDAFKLLEECKSEKKKAYEQWIDQMYYDSNNDNLKKSDLVYMERFDKDDKKTTYEKGFASSGQKQILKDAFDWGLGIDDVEILSMVYVVAEIEANDIKSDTYQIKEIKYTKELINKVLDKVVLYQDSHIDERQECPGRNCSKTIKKEHNYEWDKLQQQKQRFTEGKERLGDIQNLLNDYRDNYLHGGRPSAAVTGRWNYVYGEIQNWNNNYGRNDYGDDYHIWWNGNYSISVFESDVNDMIEWLNDKERYTPQDIITEIEYCDLQHKLYSKVLEFFSEEEITSLLGFNDIEQLWFEYTEEYFRLITSPTS